MSTELDLDAMIGGQGDDGCEIFRSELEEDGVDPGRPQCRKLPVPVVGRSIADVTTDPRTVPEPNLGSFCVN